MSSIQCRGKLYDDTLCPHETIDNSDWCVFHHPEKDKKLIAEFKKALEIQKKIQKRDHPEYIDYTEYHFPVEIIIADEEYNAVYAQRAVFHQGLLIDTSIFNGIVDFRYASFLKRLGIKDSTFKEEVQFHHSNFNDGLFITNNILYSTMDFYNNEIRNLFSITTYNWDPLFDKNQSENHYKISIGGLLVVGRPNFHENGKIEISGKIGEVTPSFAAGIVFFNTNLEKIEFLDEIWPREDGQIGKRKITIDEMLMKLPRDQIFNVVHYSPSPDNVIQVYRRLRNNYEKTNRYAEAGDFFLGEMEVNRRYKVKQRQEFDGPVSIDWFIAEKRGLLDSEKILFSLYYYLGCYGESISRPIAWSILLVIFFTFYRLSVLPPSEVYRHTYGEYLQMSIIAYFQLKSDTIIDLIQRIFSAPLLGMIFIAMKRRMERK